jgi:hypothetical protein
MCALFKLLAFYLKRRDITFRLHDTDVRCWGMQAQWELKLAQRLAEERPYRGQGAPRRNVNAIFDTGSLRFWRGPGRVRAAGLVLHLVRYERQANINLSGVLSEAS